MAGSTLQTQRTTGSSRDNIHDARPPRRDAPRVQLGTTTYLGYQEGQIPYFDQPRTPQEAKASCHLL